MTRPEFPASALAFGCGGLMGRLTGKESERLVSIALDEGVRHFDTGRLYSNGESEHVLGRTLRNRQDVTITTKVGLGRASLRPGTRLRNAVLRRGLLTAELVGPVRRPPRPDRHHAPRPDLSPALVFRSIDTSRRLLHRDTLDCLLLHEVGADQVTPALEDLLVSVLDRGLARRVGIATRSTELRTILARGRVPGTVVQMAGGPLNPVLPVPGDQTVIAHSILGSGGAGLIAFAAWVDARPLIARDLETALGEPAERDALARALVRTALAADSDDAVIVSSRCPARLLELCRAARRPADPAEASTVTSAAAMFLQEA